MRRRIFVLKDDPHKKQSHTLPMTFHGQKIMYTFCYETPLRQTKYFFFHIQYYYAKQISDVE